VPLPSDAAAAAAAAAAATAALEPSGTGGGRQPGEVGEVGGEASSKSPSQASLSGSRSASRSASTLASRSLSRFSSHGDAQQQTPSPLASANQLAPTPARATPAPPSKPAAALGGARSGARSQLPATTQISVRCGHARPWPLHARPWSLQAGQHLAMAAPCKPVSTTDATLHAHGRMGSSTMHMGAWARVPRLGAAWVPAWARVPPRRGHGSCILNPASCSQAGGHAWHAARRDGRGGGGAPCVPEPHPP
jgi:hypothetical protein